MTLVFAYNVHGVKPLIYTDIHIILTLSVNPIELHKTTAMVADEDDWETYWCVLYVFYIQLSN